MEHTLLFIDDHPIYCEGMALALCQEMDDLSVHTVDAGEAARALIAQHDVDLVLCDYRLRDENGIRVMAELSVIHPSVAMGMLCADPTPQLAARALEAGAVACLSKERDVHAMAEALRQLFKGETVFDVEPALTDTHGITQRRVDILHMAAEGQSNKQIALNLNVSERTIKDHWTVIFERLGVHNRITAIRKAHALGLIELNG